MARLFDFEGLVCAKRLFVQFLSAGPEAFSSPYNARLTREAVAPFRLAWKGQAKGGSGATFAVRPTVLTHPSKGRDGHAESG
jgi:hypothetical protein